MTGRNVAIAFVIIIFLCTSVANARIVAPYPKIPPDRSYLSKPADRIIFIRSEFTKSGREINSLWIAARDGSNQRFISYCSVGFALLAVNPPTLSPNQRKIVFSWLGNVPDTEPNSPHKKGLWVFDLETGKKELLYSEVVKKVFWSSDSRHLFFDRGVHGIFKLDVESKELKKLLVPERMERVVDAAGKAVIAGDTVQLEDLREDKILFTRDCYDVAVESTETRGEKTVTRQKLSPRRHVWVLDTRQNSIRVLSEGKEARFSSEGRTVVFTREERNAEGKVVKGICLINTDGTRKVRIGIGDYPTLSPDGKRLAFVDSGLYANPSGWFNLMVTDVSNGTIAQLRRVEDWKEVVNHHIPSFPRIFGRYGYFQESPQILWFPSSDRLVHSIGYSFFFMADLRTHTSSPLFYWSLQVDPVLHTLDESRNVVLLTSPMIKTPRRNKHPLKSSGWLNEKDIWEVSLDGKHRKMLVENGFFPLLVKL